MTGHTFETLQNEFNRFCEIKDHPREDVDFGHWQSLPEAELNAWAGRLQRQGQVVIDLFREMAQCHFFAHYQQMKSFFRQDVTDLQNSLRAHHIEIKFH